MSTSFGLRAGGSALSEGPEVRHLIGSNLRRLRRQHGYSRRELARIVRADPAALRAVERGSATPSIELLWKLAVELEVPCTAFVEGARSAPAEGRSGFFAIA